MKTRRFLHLAFWLLLLLAARAGRAQAPTPADLPGYWNLETNLTTHDYTIVRFYDGHDQLVYEARLPELYLNLAWNQASTVAVTRMTNPTTGFFVLPHVEARAYAIISLAMYDALNTIQQKNAPYALQSPLVPDASPDAAVCAAAHDALVVVLPTEQAYADSLYQALLGKISPGDAKTKGVALGQAAAKAILAKRASDGSDNA